MYIPAHFEEQNADALATLIEQFNFGTVISNVDGRPFASHLPFVYERAAEKLFAHMARANPHWQSLAGAGRDTLVMFQGPHAYVSPSWYRDPGVPTWNYTAVHVYGDFRVIEDPIAHRQILQTLTDQHETTQTQPWRADFGEEFVANMQRGTVAFEISIREVQGKFKLSQNRKAADRAQVINALASADDDLAHGVAELMQARM